MCNASPISDLVPLLAAAGARAEVSSLAGSRSLSINSDFFRGYKRTALEPNEVLVSVLLPFTSQVAIEIDLG